MRSKTIRPTTRRRSRGAAAAVASILPLAISMIPSGANRTEQPSTTHRATATPKEFSVPFGNLRDWSRSVVVTLDDVHIEGHSKVHNVNADCELHFGAHTPNFRGVPDGLVLEPMNACSEPFPGKTEQNNADWTTFGDQIKGTSVTAVGVPRIWPEHLNSGGGDSNPDHAVELHPLTTIVAGGKSFDFSPDISAGEFTGGVIEQTALSIVQETTVSVSRNGDSVDISFSAGRIGNFTVLDLVINRDSIANDGTGSFRMDGEVVIDSSTTVPVRIVTVKGSPINDDIQKIKSGRSKNVNMEGELVLFSLSPEALLNAANRSGGDAIVVERPLQLILYGMPSSE